MPTASRTGWRSARNAWPAMAGGFRGLQCAQCVASHGRWGQGTALVIGPVNESKERRTLHFTAYQPPSYPLFHPRLRIRPVSWTSPLGIPVEQPYRKLPTMKIQTSLQGVSIVNEEGEGASSASTNQPRQKGGKQGGAEQLAPINKRAQRTAFPPNYIHSLDSAHMMLTALECHKRGVAFAGGMGVIITVAVLFSHLFWVLIACPYLC